ncbi:MAG: YggT family protein [Burkholderiales bacterium]|nr:YggT family protein [Burkholderiales bacterium]
MLGILNLIINTVTGLLATVLLLRFWVQVVRIRPPLQVSQFTFQLSDWLVKPLRRLIPGVGGYDWASLIAALLVALLATFLKQLMWPVLLPHLVLFGALYTLLQWMIYGWIGLLFISVIFSWVNPSAPLAPFFVQLTNPILRPIRRVIPPFGSVDLSPIVAFLVLQIMLFALAEVASTIHPWLLR